MLAQRWPERGDRSKHVVPSGMQSKDIATALPPWDCGPRGDRRTKAQLVLLITRSLSHLLEPQHQLIEQIVQKIFRDKCASAQAFEVDALTVVVDQVATPDYSLTAGLLHKSRSHLRGKPFDTVFPVVVGGCEAKEGLAYHVSHAHIFDYPVMPSDDAGPAPFVVPDVATASQATPLLNFSLVDMGNDNSTRKSFHTQLGLPIANTLFQTGQKSTAFISRWELVEDSLQAVEHRSLDAGDYTLKLAWPELTRINRMNGPVLKKFASVAADGADVRIPVALLVEPRVVVASMGNVVTKLRANGVGEEVPASRELEEAVSDYLTSNNLEAQSVAVWALVIPRKVATANASFFKTAQKQWTDDKSNKSAVQRLVQCLWLGAKLRRVLSGGGGWGQKAGLLSLDPEEGYSVHSDSSQQLPSFLLDIQQPTGMNLPSITKPGDHIAFFALREPLPDPRSRTGLGACKPQSPYSYTFGVVPSTVDSLPSQDQVTPMSSASAKVEFFPGHFGVLSEGGMCIKRPSKHFQTKLDVPNTRFSLSTVNAASPTPSSSKRKVKGVRLRLRKYAALERKALSDASTAQRPSLSTAVRARRFLKTSESRRSMCTATSLGPSSTRNANHLPSRSSFENRPIAPRQSPCTPPFMMRPTLLFTRSVGIYCRLCKVRSFNTRPASASADSFEGSEASAPTTQGNNSAASQRPDTGPDSMKEKVETPQRIRDHEKAGRDWQISVILKKIVINGPRHPQDSVVRNRDSESGLKSSQEPVMDNKNTADDRRGRIRKKLGTLLPPVNIRHSKGRSSSQVVRKVISNVHLDEKVSNSSNRSHASRVGHSSSEQTDDFQEQSPGPAGYFRTFDVRQRVKEDRSDRPLTVSGMILSDSTDRSKNDSTPSNHKMRPTRKYTTNGKRDGAARLVSQTISSRQGPRSLGRTRPLIKEHRVLVEDSSNKSPKPMARQQRNREIALRAHVLQRQQVHSVHGNTGAIIPRLVISKVEREMSPRHPQVIKKRTRWRREALRNHTFRRPPGNSLHEVGIPNISRVLVSQDKRETSPPSLETVKQRRSWSQRRRNTNRANAIRRHYKHGSRSNTGPKIARVEVVNIRRQIASSTSSAIKKYDVLPQSLATIRKRNMSPQNRVVTRKRMAWRESTRESPLRAYVMRHHFRTIKAAKAEARQAKEVKTGVLSVEKLFGDLEAAGVLETAKEQQGESSSLREDRRAFLRELREQMRSDVRGKRSRRMESSASTGNVPVSAGEASTLPPR